MIIVKTASQLNKQLHQLHLQQHTIGFVPTMGALHQGHLSLVEKSRSLGYITIASIFVNPTQFNDPEDFKKYPVTIEQDVKQLALTGTDILFLPSVEEIYPSGTQSTLHYAIGSLENVLEGKFRPGHFQGVCQVVDRLLEIVKPGVLFLGRKDYQQCLVLKRMVELRNFGCKIMLGETVREPSGLAMSSRNTRLSKEQRLQAAAIYQVLKQLEHDYQQQNLASLKEGATQFLLSSGFDKVDYIEICNGDTLQSVSEKDKFSKQPLIALAAAFIGGVRLIDNIQLRD